MHKNTFLIGAASAFSGERQDEAGPVVDSLISSGKPSALICKTLAEVTRTRYSDMIYGFMAFPTPRSDEALLEASVWIRMQKRKTLGTGYPILKSCYCDF